MVKFSEFISDSKLNEGKDTELASLNISNDEKIYNMAMKAHNSADLKKAMVKMKVKFPDGTKIDFNKVDWEEVFVDLNESNNLVDELLESEEISEELFNKFLDITEMDINEAKDDMLTRILGTIDDMEGPDKKRKQALKDKFIGQFS